MAVQLAYLSWLLFDCSHMKSLLPVIVECTVPATLVTVWNVNPNNVMRMLSVVSILVGLVVIVILDMKEMDWDV